MDQYSSYIYARFGDPNTDDMFHYYNPEGVRTMLPEGVNNLMDFVIDAQESLVTLDFDEGVKLSPAEIARRERHLSETEGVAEELIEKTDNSATSLAASVLKNTNALAAANPNTDPNDPALTAQALAASLVTQGTSGGLIRIKRKGQTSGNKVQNELYFYNPITSTVSTYDADRKNLGKMKWDDYSNYEFVDVGQTYDNSSKVNFREYPDSDSNYNQTLNKHNNYFPAYLDNPYER